MDKWMVAIAAGAGHIAQHFKKFQQAGERMTPESSVHGSFSEKPDSPKQPSSNKWPSHTSKRRSSKSDESEVRNEVYGFGGEKEMVSGSYEGSDGILDNVEELTPRSRMSFRSRRTVRRGIRPLSSLENCVMAHVEMEYASSSLASASMQTVRPFLVTDGSNVINRASVDSYIVPRHTAEKKIQPYSEEKNSSVDATLLVCLGISFGMLYSFMENKREVEKLNRLLKQKENLIQDLEEEIEMKDSLVMQELTVDDHKSQRSDDSINDGSPHSVSQMILSDDSNEDSVFMKAKDDSFSRIETELEAELEMLELSMSSSTLERKISNLVELDPDFETGVSQGELRADVLDNITTPSPNYAVSPRELSLRLHVVLQSQLEERIKELEAEIETRHQKSWKDFSSSDAGDENCVDEPVVLNLSGEALDAYTEACDEFAKFDELDDDDGTPLNDGGTDGNELDFDEDEMEKLLIKHIVEKARQGSPAVLNAQRALFSELSLEIENKS